MSKIAFTCHIIFDKGKIKEEPTVIEALARLIREEVDIEVIPIWFNEPVIILTPKENKLGDALKK